MSSFISHLSGHQHDEHINTISKVVGFYDFVNSYNIKLNPEALTLLEAVVFGNYEMAEIYLTDTLEVIIFNWVAPNSSIQILIENFIEYLNIKRENIY